MLIVHDAAGSKYGWVGLRVKDQQPGAPPFAVADGLDLQERTAPSPEGKP